MFALWCFKYVSYHPTKNKNGALLDESEFKFSSFKSWYVHFIVTSFNLNVCVSCYIDMKTVHKMCSWFCLKLLFFLNLALLAQRNPLLPRGHQERTKKVATALLLLICLYRPPCLEGTLHPHSYLSASLLSYPRQPLRRDQSQHSLLYSPT